MCFQRVWFETRRETQYTKLVREGAGGCNNHQIGRCDELLGAPLCAVQKVCCLLEDTKGACCQPRVGPLFNLVCLDGKANQTQEIACTLNLFLKKISFHADCKSRCTLL